MKEFIDAMYDFSLTMDEDKLIELYGERLGKHLWDAYYDFRRDWMRWYGYLDHNNKQIICDYLTKINGIVI